MKVATLIILMLSNQGYWLSNHNAIVGAEWNAKGKMPAADFVWEIYVGPVLLTNGRVAIPGNVQIKCPEVRARTDARLAYRVVEQGGDKVLEKGEHAVQIF